MKLIWSSYNILKIWKIVCMKCATRTDDVSPPEGTTWQFGHSPPRRDKRRGPWKWWHMAPWNGYTCHVLEGKGVVKPVSDTWQETRGANKVLVRGARLDPLRRTFLWSIYMGWFLSCSSQQSSVLSVERFLKYRTNFFWSFLVF